MKKGLFNFIINITFGIIIAVIAVAVTTISITKKVNDYNLQYQQGVTVTVQKDEIPVLALEKGIIKSLNVQEGKVVKKGQVLAKITNPLLEAQVKALSQYPNNVSANTQKAIAKTQLSYDKITSPVNGTVGSIFTTENSPVDEYSKILTVFANDNTRLLAELSIDQYLAAEKMSKIPAFDPRLNQDFYLTPDILKPDQLLSNGQQSNKIALYFKLENPDDALSLLNGEELQLNINPPQTTVNKPIDIFVKFWNTLIK